MTNVISHERRFKIAVYPFRNVSLLMLRRCLFVRDYGCFASPGVHIACGVGNIVRYPLRRETKPCESLNIPSRSFCKSSFRKEKSSTILKNGLLLPRSSVYLSDCAEKSSCCRMPPFGKENDSRMSPFTNRLTSAWISFMARQAATCTPHAILTKRWPYRNTT